MPTRRHVTMLAGTGLLAPILAAWPAPLKAGAAASSLADTFARLETQSGGRLGIAIRDTGSAARDGYRADERFPMCSTFKMLASAAVLARVDAGREDLGRRIRFAPRDLVANSPVTKDRTGGEGMTLAELCEAAITLSDNTAGNLLLASLGGPDGVTAFARRIGDPVTRLDRTETDLNDAVPGDPRDTTTPAAMAADLESLALGTRLSAASRAQLVAWLTASKTGGPKLRAGVPADWRVGDKTARGERGTTNDIAILWPPGRKPLIVCVYITDTAATLDQSNTVIASVGRAVAAALVN